MYMHMGSTYISSYNMAIENTPKFAFGSMSHKEQFLPLNFKIV